MKRVLLALLAALLLVGPALAESEGDALLGVWKLTRSSYGGQETDASTFSLEMYFDFRDNGRVEVAYVNETGERNAAWSKWQLDGSDVKLDGARILTFDGERLYMDATMMGMNGFVMIFERWDESATE